MLAPVSGAVAVVFGSLSAGEKEYTYRTDISFKRGDIAIVKQGLQFKFVQIADTDAAIDPNANFEYAWIVQRLDTTDYDNRVET